MIVDIIEAHGTEIVLPVGDMCLDIGYHVADAVDERSQLLDYAVHGYLSVNVYILLDRENIVRRMTYLYKVTTEFVRILKWDGYVNEGRPIR